MLEGLNAVDWKNMGHHGKAGSEEIPNALQNLFDSNGEVNQGAWEVLFYKEEIYDSTPHIIPFVLKLIPRANDVEISGLLHFFGIMARDVVHVDGSLLHKSRIFIRTFDAIEAGLPLYLDFLDHPNPAI